MAPETSSTAPLAPRKLHQRRPDGFMCEVLVDPTRLDQYPKSFLSSLLDPVDGSPFLPSGTITGHTFKAPPLTLLPLLTREQIEQLEREERSVAAD
jgi:hypothetical protein